MTSNGLYIFYSIYLSDFIGQWQLNIMNWLDSLRRVRGNKEGDGEFETLKSLHGKFKIVEIESHRCYGSWSENCKSVMEVEVKTAKNIKRLIEKEWK